MEPLQQTIQELLESCGHAMMHRLVFAEELERFGEETARLGAAHPEQAHGIRGLLQKSPMIAAWARSEHVAAQLPEGMQPVRAILFDKTADANWMVAWHQDLTIAVQERQDVPDYGPWSVKDGVAHVQPPISLLERMITLRLHLDDTPSENGALKVIPGSHRHGRLDAASIAALRKGTRGHICTATAGDSLLMKPLILHASSPSARPGHRRVIHLEYAFADALHPSLQWAES
jgi:ectoine hydroxylase-related dioxygenase (phytanoyl-CoA dioxygenase family)